MLELTSTFAWIVQMVYWKYTYITDWVELAFSLAAIQIWLDYI